MLGEKNIHQITAVDIISRFVENLLRVEFPEDRFYSDSYIWIKPEENFARIGISYLIVYFFSPIVEFIFLNTPSLVKNKTPCAWLMHRDGILTIRSPIQGEIFEINKTLLQNPDVANKDPYFAGWLFKIKTKEIVGLYNYSEFLNYHRCKVEILKNELLSVISETPESTLTLQDGGKIIETVKDLLGVKRYFSLINKIFVP